MEESAQRRERLKAMRVEANEVEVSHNVVTSMPTGYLENPLLENSSVQERSPAGRRFDFYTDPMAAFAGNKRSNRDVYQNPQSCFSPPINCASPSIRPSPYPLGPRILNPTHSPSHQVLRMYEAPYPYHGPDSWRSPVGIASPFPGHQGTPGAWNRPGGPADYGFSPNSSGLGGFPSPGFGRGGSPRPYFGRGPNPGFEQGGSPSPHFGRGPSPDFGQGGSPSPHFRRGPSPDFGQGGDSSPHFGRGPRPDFGRGGNPSPYFGRGTSPGFGQGGNPSPHSGRGPSPGSGRGGGRGQGSHTCVSARERPELFCNKSMLEDPWKSLIPVVRSWLPKSISTKKARTSESTGKFSSQSSLAEYLAASLEEATEEVKNG